jgi:glycosyltransferase involved in cell wall biosynthesis
VTQAPPAVSLVIPVYNEEGRIPRFAGEILSFAAAYPEPVELLFVDDGSSDGTAALLRRETARHPLARVVSYKENAGKGRAIAVGVAEAHGELILFTDLDLSVPLALLPPFLAALRGGADVAIGSRRMPGADIRVHQPWYREFMGDVFRRITRVILLPGVSDFTCGFKGFRAGVAKDLFGSLTIPRWGFDVEILYLARRRGRRIAEIPVTWTNSEQTKVRLGRDVLGSLREIFAIRLKAWRGEYDRPATD